jgi:hypothetical protein
VMGSRSNDTNQNVQEKLEQMVGRIQPNKTQARHSGGLPTQIAREYAHGPDEDLVRLIPIHRGDQKQCFSSRARQIRPSRNIQRLNWRMLFIPARPSGGQKKVPWDRNDWPKQSTAEWNKN